MVREEIIMENYRLDRFKKAQEADYTVALEEIRGGRKRSHWIWYIFPQLKGLGRSSMSDYYGLEGLEEARAYLADPLLKNRLLEITGALASLEEKNASRVFGFPDELKVCSCMTLFSLADPQEPLFQQILDQYYKGHMDPETLRILKLHGEI